MNTVLASLVTAFLGVADASSPPSRALDLKTPDGVVLKATLYPAAKPGPGVVMFNMCDGSDRSVWEPLATKLAMEGVSALTWNYRGVGDSGGEPFKGGSLEQVMRHWREVWGPDAALAVDTLAAEEGVDRLRLGVAGASCGGFLAVLTARRMPDRIRGVVFMAGPADDEARRFVASPASPPFLGIAASGDARSAAWTKELAELSKHGSSRLVLYDEAGHGTQLLSSQKDLIPLMVEWLRETLRPPARP